MRVRYAGLLAVAATLLIASPARADEWELLGTREVSYGADHDVIPVTAREGWFRALKIEVAEGNLELYDIKVIFGNGESFSPNVRLVFRQNSRSRTIDLPGDRRVINRVEFLYRSRLQRGKATIRLYGKRGAGPAAPAPTAAPTPVPAAAPKPADGPDLTGWTRLGSRLVNFKTEKDWIEATGEGPFRRLLLVVEGGDIELFDMKIRFRNGQVFSPETRLYFRPESRTRIVDLPGDQRNITRVEFTYRSLRGGGDGRATVTLYGR